MFLPKGMDKQKTEDFIIKACEHYRKYLIRQRERGDDMKKQIVNFSGYRRIYDKRSKIYRLRQI